jgi:hypothetical protein
MKIDLAANGFDLVERPLDGCGACDSAGRPDCEENCAYAALAQARNIHRAVGMAMGKIEAMVEQPLRGIHVGIDNKRVEMEVPRARREGFRVGIVRQ